MKITKEGRKEKRERLIRPDIQEKYTVRQAAENGPRLRVVDHAVRWLFFLHNLHSSFLFFVLFLLLIFRHLIRIAHNNLWHDVQSTVVLCV